jgi:hypothetical protein
VTEVSGNRSHLATCVRNGNFRLFRSPWVLLLASSGLAGSIPLLFVLLLWLVDTRGRYCWCALLLKGLAECLYDVLQVGLPSFIQQASALALLFSFFPRSGPNSEFLLVIFHQSQRYPCPLIARKPGLF